MQTFWDTSAIVALLIQEPGTAAARDAWEKTTQPWAWRWMVIETEAALSLRSAPPSAWEQWKSALRTIRLLELRGDDFEALRAFNRGLRLRAADAAHLFVCERAASAIPGLHLVTLDEDMKATAQRIGLAVAG